jgi:predicted RNase H-like HicB family nuclease
MKIKVIVHEAEEGGYWAEVPAIPGCATQGDTFEELLKNLYEAVEGCLSVGAKQIFGGPCPPYTLLTSGDQN